MSTIILKPSQDELELCSKNFIIKNTEHPKVDYTNIICHKPWGYEFLIYSNSKIGIWFLKIKKGHGTSLHCHFNKDTLIFILDGAAKIGVYNSKYYNMMVLDSIYIPKYTFHSLSSFSEEVILLEIEIFGNTASFSDKNDLLRIKDTYIRPSIGYESSIKIQNTELEKYNFFNLKNENMHYINNTSLFIKTVSNKIELSAIKSNYIILLEGLVNLNTTILREGSILDPTNLLLTFYDPITVLSINNIHIEDRKVIHSHEQLKLVCDTLKMNNKKIVLTSGCFDIVHIGHIDFLRQAKCLGDILIVCLSSDSQITKLKGPNRPVNNSTDRLNLFKIINYVDYIIPYEEEYIETEGTLGSIMKLIEPDIWAKGGDYTKDSIREKHPYLKDIKIIDLVKGKSTSNIISNILQSDT